MEEGTAGKGRRPWEDSFVGGVVLVDYKMRRPITCYSCGRILGHVDVPLSPEGMRQFREKAEQLKREHQCPPPVVPPSARGTRVAAGKD